MTDIANTNDVFKNWSVFFGHYAKQRVYRVCSCSRTQIDWEDYRVAHRHVHCIYEVAEQA